MLPVSDSHVVTAKYYDGAYSARQDLVDLPFYLDSRSGRRARRQSVRSSLRRVPRGHGGRRPESAESARRSCTASHARNPFLDPDQRNSPPGHACLVKTARTAALADRQLS